MTVVLLFLSWIVVFQRQTLFDWVNYLSYKPTGEITSVADRIGLTSDGTFMLYAAKPEIEGSTAFNKNCSRQEQNTAILGCYANNRIYIYNVTDSRLDGIKEVTAAHEMLHAVYQRMPDNEKAQIDSLIEAEYKKLSSDPNFTDRMAFYARTEPGERDNELHSIIGTEISGISPELEAHYAKYFSNRQQLLSLFNSYNGEFAALDSQKKSLTNQLDTLNKEIANETAQYNADAKTLQADVASFNQRASAGKFTSQSAFDTERAALVARSNQISAERDTLNQKIELYNTLIKQYNDTVTQTQDLYKSIDSTLSPAPTV